MSFAAQAIYCGVTRRLTGEGFYLVTKAEDLYTGCWRREAMQECTRRRLVPYESEVKVGVDYCRVTLWFGKDEM